MWSTIKRDFQRGTMVNKIIIVNVIVFLAVNVLLQFLLLILHGAPGGEAAFSGVLQFLCVPGNPSALPLKFWTPFSYMFLHADVFHILSNMLLFYWFGIIFRDICGERRILPIYILGGLGGALFFFVYTLFIPASYLLGASASVTAIVIVAATTAPYYSVFIPLIGPVRIVWLALIMVSFSFLRVFYANTGGEIAHFGGIAFGLLYVWLNQRGIDLAEKINLLFRNISDFITRLRNPSARHMKNASKQKRTRHTQYAKARTGAANNNYENQPPHRSRDDREEQIRQDRIDSILEKIKQSGYTSLTEDEKDYLFRASKE